jgi:hypothetical protein
VDQEDATYYVIKLDVNSGDYTDDFGYVGYDRYPVRCTSKERMQ